MSKIELINAVATELGATKKEVTEIVDAILNTIVNEVASGNEISLHGFGKFASKTRTGGERKYTFGEKKGETYTVEDKVVPTISASKAFKNAVAGE